MGKLHLKRTPEEEAERQLRKRRKKEKREGKQSRYHSAQEPSPPRRKWASDDDDDATDVYGPQPSTSNGDVKDAHVHPFQPDYDEIRARLEEEQFREKMFSAFDEDERLDSLEANFNDYSHIPDRWQDSRTGPRRRLNVDEDEFLQMNPQHMDDEEYAEWVRLGMYRKTHRDEYEEKQKEKARKKERKEKEKAAKEESARLEKELDIERSRRRQEKESLHLQAAKELYESKWAALLRREGGGDEELGFEDIPWPLLAAYPKAKKQKRRDAGESPAFNLQDDFTADAVAKFVLASSDASDSEKGRKEKLRDTMLRFHPDKFEGRIMARVREVDKLRVREAVGQVARLLNDLMGDK
ncbi:hypothetical protein ONZ45_g14824 [Pleurotus djamor]|nr:hypothetical protein ONZ45_g14824 [Pleurotus djamor]